MDIHVTQSFTVIFLILKVFNLDKTASAAIVTDEKKQHEWIWLKKHSQELCCF